MTTDDQTSACGEFRETIMTEQQLGELADRARLEGQHTVVTRQGKPAAVMVPVDWYRTAQALKDAVLALLRDADGRRLPRETQLRVGDITSALGESMISQLGSEAPEG